MFLRSFCLVALLVVAGCGGGSSQPDVRAKSAVAFTPDAQKYGYCYDVDDATSCAERYCSEGSGGQTCQSLFRANEPGHYALALGKLGWGVGFSQSDSDDAGQRAMNQCQRQTEGCRIVESWQADGVK